MKHIPRIKKLSLIVKCQIYFKKIVLLALALSQSIVVYSQNINRADSLKKLVPNKHDSVVFNLYIEISSAYSGLNTDSAVRYGELAKQIANKNGNLPFLMGNALSQIGVSYYYGGAFDKAENYLLQAKRNAEQEKNWKLLSRVHTKLGACYEEMGEFTKSINSYSKSLEIGKQHDCIDVTNYNNLGVLAYSMGNSDMSIKYFQQALKIDSAKQDLDGIAYSLNNIGAIHIHNEEYNKALRCLLKALTIRKQLSDEHSYTSTLLTIGKLYLAMEDFENAKKYGEEALELRKNWINKYGEGEVHYFFAKLYRKTNDIQYSFHHLNIGIEIFEEQQALLKLRDLYTLAYNYYSDDLDYKKALIYHEKLSAIKDSIITKESNSSLNELKTRYETEKKELEIEKLQTEQTAKDEIIAKEKTLKYVLYSGLGLVLLFALFLFNRIKVTQKQKQVIEKQKEEVDNQRKIAEEKTLIVSEKNKEITDSINYAKRIQDAILPAKEKVKEILPDSFVFFKPKDIVSGDFYWMESVNGKSLFAAVDCTGHGVPGALMSVVGHNGLTKATNERSYDSPADILKVLNQTVSKTLQAHKNEVKDGMDISICSMDFNTNKLEFAAAMNPLYYIHNNELIELKGDKQPIGGKVEGVKYANHTLQLQKGDTVYLFTDGFADQFGGDRGKKYKYKPFKELLLSVQDKTMEEQHTILSKEFEEWKGDLEQVDDVCVIGVRV